MERKLGGHIYGNRTKKKSLKDPCLIFNSSVGHFVLKQPFCTSARNFPIPFCKERPFLKGLLPSACTLVSIYVHPQNKKSVSLSPCKFEITCRKSWCKGLFYISFIFQFVVCHNTTYILIFSTLWHWHVPLLFLDVFFFHRYLNYNRISVLKPGVFRDLHKLEWLYVY